MSLQWATYAAILHTNIIIIQFVSKNYFRQKAIILRTLLKRKPSFSAFSWINFHQLCILHENAFDGRNPKCSCNIRPNAKLEKFTTSTAYEPFFFTFCTATASLRSLSLRSTSVKQVQMHMSPTLQILFALCPFDFY